MEPSHTSLRGSPSTNFAFLRWLSRFRRYVGVVEKVTGTALVATGVIIFIGAMPMFAGWILDLAPILGRIG